MTRNAILAALYTVVGVILPATALANYRLATALYVLAAWNPLLIPGLALGNALAGIPQGPVDIALGGLVGLATAWTCARLGTRWAPLAVLVIPTVVVPLWLAMLFGMPYFAVLPVLLKGQIVAAVLGWLLLRSDSLRRLAQPQEGG